MLGGSVTPSSLDLLRLRNRREERRLKVTMDRKHGLRDAHAYRLAEMAKERRLMERELERIGITDVTRGHTGLHVKTRTPRHPKLLEPLLPVSPGGRRVGRAARGVGVPRLQGEEALQENPPHLEEWQSRLLEGRVPDQQARTGLQRLARRREEVQPLNLRQLKERMENLLGSPYPFAHLQPGAASPHKARQGNVPPLQDPPKDAGTAQTLAKTRTEREASDENEGPGAHSEQEMTTRRKVSPERPGLGAQAQRHAQAAVPAARHAPCAQVQRAGHPPVEDQTNPGGRPSLQREAATLQDAASRARVAASATGHHTADSACGQATAAGDKARAAVERTTERDDKATGTGDKATATADQGQGAVLEKAASSGLESSFAVVHWVSPSPAPRAARGLPGERPPPPPGVNAPRPSGPAPSGRALPRQPHSSPCLPAHAVAEPLTQQRKQRRRQALGGVRFQEEPCPPRPTVPLAAVRAQAWGEESADPGEAVSSSQQPSRHGPSDSEGPQAKRRAPRAKFSTLLSLSAADMKSVRSDVNRRLGGGQPPSVRSGAGQAKRTHTSPGAPTAAGSKKADPPRKESEAGKPAAPADNAAPTQIDDVTEDAKQEAAAAAEYDVTETGEGDKSRRRKSRVKETAAVQAVARAEFDADRYNPDGTLRQMHRMPDSDKAWREAQNARYIRLPPRLSRETDKELSIKEIFSK